MLASFNESDDDDDAASEASSAPIPNPQRDYFGNSGFYSPNDIPGLKDL
jgi:hypothetical protein